MNTKAKTTVPASAHAQKPGGDPPMDIQRQKYEYIAHQINREDTLINYRLSWALTANGFLFAALAFMHGDKPPPAEVVQFLRSAIPIVGGLVSLAGLLGVVAGQLQINELTRAWRDLGDSRWPRPFGNKYSFIIGTLPSLAPPFALTWLWSAYALRLLQ